MQGGGVASLHKPVRASGVASPAIFWLDGPFRIAALKQSKRLEERDFYLPMAVREHWVTAFARFL